MLVTIIYMSNNEECLRGLQEVRVSKESLLDVIKDNRTKHAQQYDEAYTGWKVEVLKKLESDVVNAKKEYRRMLKDHKRRIRDAESRVKRAKTGDFKTDVSYFSISKPDHHIEDYNGAIKKLEMSLDTELELMPQDFEKFVMDQWAWKQDFMDTWRDKSGTLTAYNSIYNAPSGLGIMSGSMIRGAYAAELLTTGSITTALLNGTYSTNKIF